MLWLEAGNAALHTGMALCKRRNPGVASVVLLMGPHAVAGMRWMRRSGRLTPRASVVAAAVGLSGITGLPLAMKVRMRRAVVTAQRAGNIGPRRTGIPLTDR